MNQGFVQAVRDFEGRAGQKLTTGERAFALTFFEAGLSFAGSSAGAVVAELEPQEAVNGRGYKVLGEKIRRLRQQKMWTQEQLAKAADLPAGSISRIETGVHRPQLGTVGKIATALGVDADDLIEWDG